MKPSPEIAIIDANTLTCMGLRGLIERMMPMATVRTFNSFEQLVRDTPDMYFHYFISAQTLLEHSAFFIERKEKTIVLTNGAAGTPQTSHFHTLNIYLGDPNGLSTREIEVLTLIVRGLTNKEIADRLCISTTTVISHRKNIMEKLNVRSVSGLTIYAVMNGYIEADRI